MNKLFDLTGKPLYFETFNFNNKDYVSISMLVEDSTLKNAYGDKAYKPIKFSCALEDDVKDLLDLNNELVKVTGYYDNYKFKICSYEVIRKKK